jgi:hypothetical protein
MIVLHVCSIPERWGNAELPVGSKISMTIWKTMTTSRLFTGIPLLAK